MALRFPWIRAARAARAAVRPACTRAASQASGAAPPPACRARPALAQPLTCDRVSEKNSKSAQGQCEVSSHHAMQKCDQDLDPVAQRHKFAKLARQADYAREVAQRAARGRASAAPPPAPYRLGAARRDGGLHTVPRCGAERGPERGPDAGCRIKGDAHLDPCAHRRRVMIQIERSASVTKQRPAPATSPGPARRAEDSGWGAHPPPPAPVPPRCRRPTIVERLRGRSESRDVRRLHTSVIFSKPEKSIPSASGGIEGMFRSKENLKEAGLGRVVVEQGVRRAPESNCPSGRLELCVPPGTRRVAVQVSVQGAAGVAGAAGAMGGPTVGATSAAAAAAHLPAGNETKSIPCNNFGATCSKRDPWLSIKKIQKKLTGCHNEENTSGPQTSMAKEAKCPAMGPSPGAKGPAMGPSPGAGPPAGSRSRRPSCEPPAPLGCEASNKNGNEKANPKLCSSTTTFLANTIVVNS